MADCDNSTYKVDALIVDGVAINIEDASATVDNLAGFENESIAAAGAGKNYVKRKKMVPHIKAKLLLSNPQDVEKFSGLCKSSITLRDQHSGKRIMFGECSFAKLGSVGNGSVDIEFIASSRPVFM